MVGAKVIPLRRGELVEGPSLAEEARDGELVDRARKGDRWAAGKLFERHHQQIYNLAFWMCSGSVEDAKDITQEAFLRAFKNLRGFRGDSSFYTWLCRIAINICLDNRRKSLKKITQSRQRSTALTNQNHPRSLNRKPSQHPAGIQMDKPTARGA